MKFLNLYEKHMRIDRDQHINKQQGRIKPTLCDLDFKIFTRECCATIWWGEV
jgi:hypothetical protein